MLQQNVNKISLYSVSLFLFLLAQFIMRNDSMVAHKDTNVRVFPKTRNSRVDVRKIDNYNRISLWVS